MSLVTTPLILETMAIRNAGYELDIFLEQEYSLDPRSGNIDGMATLLDDALDGEDAPELMDFGHGGRDATVFVVSFFFYIFKHD